ncbi:MAG: anhydro-N-acetylmuramic acid kinase [Candidatus Eremiobacteraeota bacterium]|nr:anhydro-N-acetylmuramic acid kinase [Candidatus Eremiobacteraeota bacterium]
MLAVGLMSGTSLDGIDAALVSILPIGRGYAVELRHFQTIAFEPNLYQDLIGSLPPNTGSIAAAAQLHHALGRAYAQAARDLIGQTSVGYVASHGQTVWHDGTRHVTFQLGDAFAIRDAVNATVCYDFRSADCAAGGLGAPLVAHVDQLLLGDEREDRAALNLGGIANVTLLRRGRPAEAVAAFDTGPANMLLDAFVSERTGGERSLDVNGALAAAGCPNAELLAAMLTDAYFAALPPKTTGREYFGAHFLQRYHRTLERMSLEDGAATLTELTAASVARAIARAGFSAARVIVSGGGAHNPTMLARIAARLGHDRVETSDRVGMPVDAKEAMAFAVLGYETLRERVGNVPAATGARHPVVLGAIAPSDLRTLLAAIERECRVCS